MSRAVSNSDRERYVLWQAQLSLGPQRLSLVCVTCFWFYVLQQTENFKVRFPGLTMVPTHPGFFRTSLISRTLFLCAHKPLKFQYFSNRTMSLRLPPPKYAHTQIPSGCGSWFGVWKAYCWGIILLIHSGFFPSTSHLSQSYCRKWKVVLKFKEVEQNEEVRLQHKEVRKYIPGPNRERVFLPCHVYR